MFFTSTALSGTATVVDTVRLYNEVFSVLIDGGLRCLCHKRTCAISNPFRSL